MPRYFFHVIDGTAVRDQDGTELPSIYVAQAEAIRLCGEILRDMGGRFWNGTEWRLEVENEQGHVLFVLHFSAEERIPGLGSEADPAGDPKAGPATGPEGGPAPRPRPGPAKP